MAWVWGMHVGGGRWRGVLAAVMCCVTCGAVIAQDASTASRSSLARSTHHHFSRDHLIVGLPHPLNVRGLLEFRDGRVEGFARQVAEEAARVMGFSVEFRELGDNGVGALLDGTVDVVAPMSVIVDQLDRVSYSTPLLVVRGAVYTRQGSAGRLTAEMLKAGGTVAVAKNGIGQSWCEIAKVPYTVMDSLPAALRAVLDGKADYVITTQIAGRVDIERLAYRGLQEHDLDDDRLWRSFSLGCRVQDVVLAEDLSAGLAILRDNGRFSALYDESMGRIQPHEAPPVVSRERVLMILGAAVLIGVGAYAIAQRRLAQRTNSLRASEARFRVLFDESPDGVMILDPGTLSPTEFNPAMSALLGRSREELLGLPAESWCGEWNDPKHQDDLRRVLAAGSGDFDTRLRRSDGAVIDVRCRVRPVAIDGAPRLQAIFRDITSAKRAREAVERERRLFLAGPVVGFRWRLGAGWPVEYVSENVSQFGYAANDLITGKIPYSTIIHPDDMPRIAAQVNRNLESGSSHFFQEYRLKTADGRWIWLADYTTIVRDASGAATHFEGYVFDSTNQKVAADAIRDSEERYRAIVENTPALVFSYVISPEGQPHLRLVNSQEARWMEVFPWLKVGRDYRETIRPYIHPDDVEAYDAEVERARRDKDRFEIEFRLKARSGEYRSLHSLAIALHAEQGTQWQCMLVDVTELRRASEAARRSEERYREIFHRSHDAIVVFRPEDELILDANERALRLYGYSRAEFVGKSFSMVSANDEHSRAAIQRTLDEGIFSDSAWKQRRRDGSNIHVDVISSVIDYEGTRAILSFNRDVTGRLKAESALSESERRYRSFVQHSSEGVWCIDFPVAAPVTLPVDEQIRLFYQHGVVAECNDAMARMYGLQSADQLLGMRLADMMPASDPHNIEYLRSIIRSGYRIEDAETHEIDVSGNPKYFLNSLLGVVEDGKIVRAWGIQRDITAKKLAESALVEAQERFRIAVESADLGAWTYDLSSQKVTCDARYLAFFGIEGDASKVDAAELRSRTHPDDLERVETSLAQAAAGEGVYRIEFRVVRPDKSVRWISSRGAVRRDKDGTPAIIAGASMDITEPKLAAEERERLAEQLRQAQKLESLGVMAGGIAHDFNNLLVAIMGNAALALKTLPQDAEAHRSIYRIEQAAARASELTRQLLTYAGRDQAEPQAIDLSSVVSEMVELVEVSVDRAASLSIELAPSLPAIHADPTQCRQVVMNLLSNASEALEGKPGQITVRTFVEELGDAQLAHLHTQGCAKPGQFVCLQVSDTGCGMDPAVKIRIFEPFFTTKFTGRGLGLTAVLGIVRRHAGAIGIDSRPGGGTTFRVYFPASSARTPTAPTPKSALDAPRGSGTILVIDDEAMVRDVARMCLEDAGFRVLAIPDGPQAISLAQDASAKFDGILLDMTMPTMSGPEVFTQLRRIRGNVPVLLTSGYAEENAAEQLLAEPKVSFIQKPYRPIQLVKAIQDLIAT